jgi:hypothetical protein
MIAANTARWTRSRILRKTSPLVPAQSLASVLIVLVQGRWLLGDEGLKTRGRVPQRDI